MDCKQADFSVCDEYTQANCHASERKHFHLKTADLMVVPPRNKSFMHELGNLLLSSYYRFYPRFPLDALHGLLLHMRRAFWIM